MQEEEGDHPSRGAPVLERHAGDRRSAERRAGARRPRHRPQTEGGWPPEWPRPAEADLRREIRRLAAESAAALKLDRSLDPRGVAAVPYFQPPRLFP